MTSRELTSYCGLYCEDCIPSKKRLYEVANELRGILENIHFENYAEYKSLAISEFKMYKDFKRVLNSFEKIRCKNFCFNEPRSEGGCSQNCKIRICVLNKNLDGCWKCCDYETCNLISEMEELHPNIKSNLKTINEYGIDKWHNFRAPHYIWSKETYIAAIGEKHRKRINQIIKDEWAGPTIVTRGNTLDATALPGFVCLENEEVIGAVLYDIQNSECEIIVLISYKENCGVGSKLIQAVKEAARSEGCNRLWLITTNDNTHAIRYYQKRGFVLKAVHINAVEQSRKLKPEIPATGIGDIPIMHEFEFEVELKNSKNIKGRAK